VAEVLEGLVKELEAYKGNLGEILVLGLRQIRMQQAVDCNGKRQEHYDDP